MTKRKLNRREFLGLLGLGALVALIARLTQTLLAFAHPPKARNQIGGVFELGNYADLSMQTMVPQRFPQGRFWLVEAPEGVLALNGMCTHLDCLFDWDATEQHFVCPCHGSQFSLEGDCLNGPATRNLDRYVVRLRDETGALVTETDPIAGRPVPLPVPTPTQDSETTPALINLSIEVDTGLKIRGREV